jgi:hypothetical protein
MKKTRAEAQLVYAEKRRKKRDNARPGSLG